MNKPTESETMQIPPIGKTRFWNEVSGSDTLLLRHLGILWEKIEKIIQEEDPKDPKFSLRLQRAIFRSRIRPGIRRYISGSVAEILRNLPESARNDRAALRSELSEVANRMRLALQPETNGDELPAETNGNELPAVTEPVGSEAIFPMSHRQIRKTILDYAPEFETTEESLGDIGEKDEFWYVLLLEILETQHLRLRDVRLYRFCEFFVSAEIAKREAASSVLSGWALKILMNPESHEKFAGMDARERNTFWAHRKAETESGNGEGIPRSEFVGPRLGERKKVIKISDRSDVPADFAWAADMLVRKFEKMKREALAK